MFYDDDDIGKRRRQCDGEENGDLFDFPVYESGDYGGYMPNNGRKRPDEILEKSNRRYKILSIILSVLLVICMIATCVTVAYFSKNRSKETTSDVSELARVVSANTVNSVAEVKSVGGTLISSGSGFIIRSSVGGTYIMTNKHVIENSLEISGKSYRQTGDITVHLHGAITADNASVVSVSLKLDMAILKISAFSASLYPAVSFANSDNLQYGSFTLAAGNPLGYGISVTEGIISSPKVNIADVGASNVDFIQISNAINQGNSGGPLFDKNSRVIGMNTYKKMQSSNGNIVEGMSYALPSSVLVDFINSAGLGFNVGIIK